MPDDVTRRVLASLGDDDLIDRLANLPGADLTSLLLGVMRARARRLTPADVLRRYGSDRFSTPGVVPVAELDAARRTLVEQLPAHFERITLAPVAPFGTHAVLGEVDQNNVLATVRGNEVAADTTAGLALEAAVRRRADRSTPVHLAASQRITRAQPFEGPLSFAHFEIFGLVTAGRDTGNLEFERETVAEHIDFYVKAMSTLAGDLRVQITDYHGNLGAVMEAVATRVGDRAVVEPWADRPDGRAYYHGLRFSIDTVSGTESQNLADGGIVDWTQRLVSDRKERMVTSGIGLDRLAVMMHSG